MSIQTALSLLALLCAGGGVAVLYERNQALEERLAALEESRPLAGDDTQRVAAAPGLSGSGVRREVAELQGLSEGLVRRMDALERREDGGTVAVAVGEQVAALTDSPAFSDAVRGVVLEMATNDVDFRARIGTGQQTQIPKNAPFSKVADVLKLDASQEDRLSKDLQAMQQDLFGILSEEREDGVVPMELIAKAEALGEGDPKRGELFMRLFTLKIPRSDETYMQRAVKLQSEFGKRSRVYLRPEQTEIWDAVKVDWFSIKFN